jgi:hypothetical protein
MKLKWFLQFPLREVPSCLLDDKIPATACFPTHEITGVYMIIDLFNGFSLSMG